MDEGEDEEQKRQLELLKVLGLLKILEQFKENKRFLDEERAEVKKRKQIQLEADQKQAGELWIATERMRQEQAKKQKEAEEQECKDKEIWRRAMKKIDEQPSSPFHPPRKKSKAEIQRNRRDDLIWSIIQENPKTQLAYCKRCAELDVKPLPTWKDWPGWVKAYNLKRGKSYPWRKLIKDDKSRIKQRYLSGR